MLILHSYNRDFAPYNVLSSSFRTRLAEAMGEPVEFYEESLDAARLGEREGEGPFIDYLRSRFGNRPLDLLVPLGAPAAHFSLRHRADLFPDTPCLLAAVEQRHLKSEVLTERDTVIPVVLNFSAIVDHIFALLPETRRIVVIIGDSELEKFWQAEMARELMVYTGRVQFDWYSGQSLEDMRRRLPSLPPGTAILFTILAVDGAGIPHQQDQALTSLHGVTAAPLFGIFDTQLGLGILGGPLIPIHEVAERSAAAAAKILRGESVAALAKTPTVASALEYDWRELERWQIDEERLPPGSRVHFRPPSFWTDHRGPFLAAAATLTIQAIFIVALLVQRSRLRRAEQVSRDLSARLLTVYEDERRRVARELHDDITQRLAALAMDAGSFERTDDPDRKGAILLNLRTRLGQLSEDVHTLSYQLHPAVLDDLGLAEALRSICDRFARIESIQTRVVCRDVPADLPRDAALCLFRVAQEALRNVARHAHAGTVEVSLMAVDGGMQLTVNDDGVGFEPAANNGSGHLGHASMRERVQLLGGELDIDSSRSNGTLVVAWIPLKGKVRERH